MELRKSAERGADEPACQVHSVHTEIEGGSAFHRAFEEQIRGWKSDGVAFLTFEDLCRTLQFARTLAGNAREQKEIPARRLSWTTLPGRATPVATGVPLPA